MLDDKLAKMKPREKVKSPMLLRIGIPFVMLAVGFCILCIAVVSSTPSSFWGQCHEPR